MKPYAVVFQGQMLVTSQLDFIQASEFAVRKNGEQWKYATVMELESIELYDSINRLLYEARCSQINFVEVPHGKADSDPDAES